MVDTNVVLDVLLAQEPFAIPAAALFALVDEGQVRGLLGATTTTTVYDLAARDRGPRMARSLVDDLLSMSAIAPVDVHTIRVPALVQQGLSASGWTWQAVSTATPPTSIRTPPAPRAPRRPRPKA